MRGGGKRCHGSTSTPASDIALQLPDRRLANPGRAGQELWRCAREYQFHPEAKCADANVAPCSKQTVGLLRRRRIVIDGLVQIGKESNRLEEVEEQSLLDPSDVYTYYADPRRDEWAMKILPKLKAMPLRELIERTGYRDRRSKQYGQGGDRNSSAGRF